MVTELTQTPGTVPVGQNAFKQIKASISAFKDFQKKAEKLSDVPLVVLKQEDTSFNCSSGRLKLRQQNDGSHLVLYKREDKKGPKFSDLNFAQVADAKSLKAVLGLSYGIKGVVKKTRFLYMVGQTRVHVDQVESLGDFMEQEVIMKPDQSIEEGELIAKDLMKKLGVKEQNLIEGAYMDLILKKINGHSE